VAKYRNRKKEIKTLVPWLNRKEGEMDVTSLLPKIIKSQYRAAREIDYLFFFLLA
jgi:hypothetical protein